MGICTLTTRNSSWYVQTQGPSSLPTLRFTHRVSLSDVKASMSESEEVNNIFDLLSVCTIYA